MPSSIDYAIRESKIGMNLDHPFLIKTYCTLYDEKNIYQLMEFVEGSTLHNLSRQRKNKLASNQLKTEKGTHPIKAIKEIVSELLEAIVYLHGRKIVHRDLKPANIFISNVLFFLFRTMHSRLEILGAPFTKSPMILWAHWIM